MSFKTHGSLHVRYCFRRGIPGGEHGRTWLGESSRVGSVGAEEGSAAAGAGGMGQDSDRVDVTTQEEVEDEAEVVVVEEEEEDELK